VGNNAARQIWKWTSRFPRFQFSYRGIQRAAVTTIRLAAHGDSALVSRRHPSAKLSWVDSVPHGEAQLGQTAPAMAKAHFEADVFRPEFVALSDDRVIRLRRALPLARRRSRGLGGFQDGDTSGQPVKHPFDASHDGAFGFGGSTSLGFGLKISRSSASNGGGHGKPGTASVLPRETTIVLCRQERAFCFITSPPAPAPIGFLVGESGRRRD
jgi:hypothetical protein